MTGARRLALDLVATDLADPDAIARLIANHVVVPARMLLGLPRDPSAEDMNKPIGLSFGMDFRPLWPSTPPDRDTFEPFLRGYVLLSALLPGAIEAPADARAFLAVPGASLIAHALSVALVRDEDLAVLARGLLGERVARPQNAFVLRDYQPRSNGTALAELARARDLVVAALGEPDDPGVYARKDIGMAALSREVAFTIDEVLRRDVHWRLVWLGDRELGYDEDSELDDEGDPILLPLIVDRGVVDALVPETISGLVALDLVEMLRVGKGMAPCAVCRQLVVLDPRRAGRARRGEPVYHPDCHEEFRLRFVRDYQRQRRKGRVNSTSALSVSTDEQ